MKELIENMRSLAKITSRYNHTLMDEEVLSCLKHREVTVDGTEIFVYFSVSGEDVVVETLQITGKFFNFLPFNLVCKVAKLFLGEENLCLLETVQDDRKIYVWTVSKKDGKAIPFSSKLCKYDGLTFFRVEQVV